MRYLPIDKQLFVDNRKNFSQQLKENSMAIFFLPINRQEMEINFTLLGSKAIYFIYAVSTRKKVY